MTKALKIAFTLPGKNYHQAKPLFFYLHGLSDDLGLQLVHLRYPIEDFTLSDLPAILEGLKGQIENALALNNGAPDEGQTIQFIFIAKSVGTLFLKELRPWLNTRFSDHSMTQILLTPLSQAIDDQTFDWSTLVVYGEEDSLLSPDARMLCHLNTESCLEIKGGNHSLTIGNLEADLNALVTTYKAMATFLESSTHTDCQSPKPLFFKNALSKASWEVLARVLEDAHALYEPLMGDAFQKLALRYQNEGPKNPHHYWLIIEDQEPVGFCAFEPLTGDTIYLIGLYLFSNQQGKGLGKRVLKRLEGYWRYLGYGNVRLQAHQKATWAIAFYKRCNYQIIDPSYPLEVEALKNRTLKNTVLLGRQI